jgi:hypothetical protein
MRYGAGDSAAAAAKAFESKAVTNRYLPKLDAMAATLPRIVLLVSFVIMKMQ